MVHNMLTSLRKMDEVHFWENRPFSGVMPEPRRCKPEEIRKTIKKRAKRIRTAYTTEQIRALELIFVQNKYITLERRREISKTLNIGDKSVKIWFQNRRMKEKRESSECSSDSSNETVTDEGSPALTVPSESPNSVQSNVINGTQSVDSSQYQVPYFHALNVSEQQNQNVLSIDYTNMQSNCTQFYNDFNIYPTEYYPYNDGNYTNDYNSYYYCQQENLMQNMHNNYWSSNNDASCHFYN